MPHHLSTLTINILVNYPSSSSSSSYHHHSIFVLNDVRLAKFSNVKILRKTEGKILPHFEIYIDRVRAAFALHYFVIIYPLN